MLYRNALYSLTNETPAKLFQGRNLRTCLDLIRTDTRTIMAEKSMNNAVEKKEQLVHSKRNDHVNVLNYQYNDKWING